uniref:Basic proline-rich protein-like n=1 Tax=Knipowitschia caucasica TaxID=637954 RepID=A0AAV2JRW5_KNICA
MRAGGDSARHAPHRATAVAPLDRPSYHTIPPLEPRLPPPRLLAGARPPATHRRLQPPPAWISRPSRCPRRPVPPPPPPTAIPPVGGNPPPGPREPLPPPQHARAPPLPLPSAGLPAIRLPALALGPPPSPPHPRPAALDCSENPRPGGEPPRCPLATTHRVAVTRRPLRPQSARSGRTTNTPPHHRKTKAPPRLTAQHSPPRPGTPAQLPGPPVLRYRYRPPPEQGAIPCRTPSRLPPPRGGRDRPTPRRFTPPARSRPASASPVGRHCRPSAALPRCPPLRCGWGGRAPMPRRPGARVTPSAIPPPSAPPPAPPSPVPRWCPAWPPHRARLPRPLKPVSPGPLPPPRSASPRGRGSRKTLTETPRLAPIRTTTREPLPPPLPRHVKKRRSPPPTTGFPPRCRGRPPAPPWYAPGPAPPPLPPGPDRATPCPSARPRGRPMVTAPRCAERPGSPKRDPAHGPGPEALVPACSGGAPPLVVASGPSGPAEVPRADRPRPAERTHVPPREASCRGTGSHPPPPGAAAPHSVVPRPRRPSARPIPEHLRGGPQPRRPPAAGSDSPRSRLAPPRLTELPPAPPARGRPHAPGPNRHGPACRARPHPPCLSDPRPPRPPGPVGPLVHTGAPDRATPSSPPRCQACRVPPTPGPPPLRLGGAAARAIAPATPTPAAPGARLPTPTKHSTSAGQPRSVQRTEHAGGRRAPSPHRGWGWESPTHRRLHKTGAPVTPDPPAQGATTCPTPPRSRPRPPSAPSAPAPPPHSPPPGVCGWGLCPPPPASRDGPNKGARGPGVPGPPLSGPLPPGLNASPPSGGWRGPRRPPGRPRGDNKSVSPRPVSGAPGTDPTHAARAHGPPSHRGPQGGVAGGCSSHASPAVPTGRAAPRRAWAPPPPAPVPPVPAVPWPPHPPFPPFPLSPPVPLSPPPPLSSGRSLPVHSPGGPAAVVACPPPRLGHWASLGGGGGGGCHTRGPWHPDPAATRMPAVGPSRPTPGAGSGRRRSRCMALDAAFPFQPRTRRAARPPPRGGVLPPPPPRGLASCAPADPPRPPPGPTSPRPH